MAVDVGELRSPVDPDASRPATIAWLAAVPCALAAAVAAALLGPPLGRALLAPGGARFLQGGIARPEPTEHARFLIAALAPFALSLIVVLAARRPPALAAGTRRRALRASELLLLAAAVCALVAQHALAYRVGAGVVYAEHRMYFTPATLGVALAATAALAALPRRAGALGRLRSLARETPARRVCARLAALALTVLWTLTAFNTEASIGLADPTVRVNDAIWLDETFALLNGSVPLVQFHAQYAQLLPYATAGAMTLLGTSVGVWAGLMVAATSAAMLAVYATLRRVVGSSLLALALFAPVLATGFFKIHGTLQQPYGPASTFSLFPIRYGGPYVLAWLLARQLDGERPRRPLALCFAAGLVALNNPEFGVPAFAATAAALLWTLPQPTWRRAVRLLAEALLGGALALAAFALLTLIVGGSLPRLSLLSEFSRIYGLDGFGMLPMPVAGLHLAIYLTFASALVVATVRAVGGARQVALTGLLCWIGVFGLGAGGYYVGRSAPDVLIDLFSPWALALALLLVVAARATLARPSRRPTAAELAVALGFGIALCSLAQTPTPWSQAARLRASAPLPALRSPAAVRFVRAHAQPGEAVLVVLPLGHRIAYDAGVTDVFPYSEFIAPVTLEQWAGVRHIARERHVRSAFVEAAYLGLFLPLLQPAGFAVAASDSATQLVQLTRPRG